MLLEEKFEVNASRELVWATLRDPTEMLPCIPGCEGIEETGSGEYRTNIKIAVGPIKASFALHVKIVDEQPPTSLHTTVSGEEGTRASQLRAINEMRLTEIDATRTEVYYRSELNLTGRLGRFGAGMMKKTAERLMATFQQNFKTLVEEKR